MQPQKTWNEGLGQLLDQEMMEAFLTLPPLVLVRFNALIQKHIETTIAEEREKIIKMIEDVQSLYIHPDSKDVRDTLEDVLTSLKELN